MVKVYANLLGDWVCLNDDPDCTIGDDRQYPASWFEGDAPMHAMASRSGEFEHSFHSLDYIDLRYHGTRYRISPACIQIVFE